MREGDLTSDEVRFLDEYRRSFGGAHESVVTTIRRNLQLEPTGRPAKSTMSLVEKLRRESIRLSQIQDIAGCRVVVADSLEQDRVVAALIQLFPGASVADRRNKPSHGYRAVHVIAKIAGKAVEIQVRSGLQHVWAELSEKLSDVLDPAIKYGGGSDEIRYVLYYVSTHIASLEDLEKRIKGFQGEDEVGLDELRQQTIRLKERLAASIGNLIAALETKRKRE